MNTPSAKQVAVIDNDEMGDKAELSCLAAPLALEISVESQV